MPDVAGFANSHATSHATAHVPAAGFNNIPDVRPALHGLPVRVWEKERGALHPTVVARLGGWRRKYSREEEEGEVESVIGQLEKAGIDVQAAKRVEESDGGFNGEFETGRRKEEEEAGVNTGDGWKCVVCLEVNETRCSKCGLCEKVRVGHGDK